MIVYYHGALPLDVYYLNSWSHVNHSIPLRPVVDHFMFKVPGFRLLLDAFGALWGPRSRLEEVLREGEIVIVSPGGVREVGCGYISAQRRNIQLARFEVIFRRAADRYSGLLK